MATNPNPFLRSPLERAADDLNREAEALRVAIPEPQAEELALPEPEPQAVMAPPAAAVKPARKKTGTAQDLMPPDDMVDLFKATAEHYEVPVNVLMALAQQESNYNAGAVGVPTKWGKAKGMMQNLDDTAKGLGIDAMDPNQAVPAAAFQIRQRLDKGMSMEDAVMEHFAGPNRAQWGKDTAAYGREVMDKAGVIGKFLIGPSAQFAAVPTPPAPGSRAANRMSTTMNRDDYLNTVVANNPQATAQEIKMLMGQFDADNARRGSPVEDRFATMADPNATFDAKLDAKLAARQKNKGVVPGMPSVAPEQQAGPTDSPSLKNDMQRGLRNLQAMAYGVAGMGADAMGMDAKAEKLLGEYVEITENNLRDNPAAIGTYKNVQDLGDAGRYAVEAVLENAAMIIPSLLTGGIGAAAAKKAAEKVVGGMVQKQIAQGIGRKVAEQNALKYIAKRVTIGATAGAAASSVGMEAGSIMGDIYAETGEMRAGTAALGGLAAGALDAIGPVLALRKIMGPVADDVAGHVMARLGKEVGLQFLAESLTEGAQTFIEKAAVRSVDGKELLNTELLDEMIDASLKGGIGGAVMGGASSAVEAVRAPAQVAPLPSDAAPLPVTDSPLAQAMSEAAAPAARAVVVDQAGQQVAATVTDASPNADAFEVVDDDGNVRVITDMDGLQILPVESEAGPLTSSLADVAAAEPVEVESSQLPATGAEPTLAPPMENSDAVSPITQDGTTAAAAIAPAEPGAAVAAPEPGADVAVPAMADAAAPDALTDWKANPYSAYQFADAETAARFMDKKQVSADQFEAVQTGKVRWQIVPKTAAQPATQGATDERRSADGQPGNRDDSVRVLDVGRGRDAGDGGSGTADGIGGGDNAAVRDQRRAGAGSAGVDGTDGVAVGSDTAKPKPSLKIPKEGFGTAELAKAFRKKAKLDASHEVVQTGRVRWEVRAKGEAAPNSNWQEKEKAKAAKLKAALATANANASARKAPAPATAAQPKYVKPHRQSTDTDDLYNSRLDINGFMNGEVSADELVKRFTGRKMTDPQLAMMMARTEDYALRTRLEKVVNFDEGPAAAAQPSEPQAITKEKPAAKPKTKKQAEEVKMSVGAKPGALDSDSLRKSITTGALGPVVDSMVESGLIVLHADASTLPTKKAPKAVQALTTPDGKVHLVASNLNGTNARAVMLHEAFHQGGEKLIGTEQWNVLMRRMKSLMAQGKEASKGGKANVFYEKARARVASAKDQGAVEPQFEAEEFAAYAIEEYESAPTTVKKWVDDLLGMVKAWLLKRFGAQFGAVTPAQLSAIAKLAIMDVAAAKRGEMFGPAGELLSVGNRTIEVDGVRRPIENSKGQLIALDFDKQQAFWKWFAKSEAVDKDGRPLVAYHGTDADFESFSEAKNGIFFAAKPRVANAYADNDGGNVIAAYLSIQKPFHATKASILKLVKNRADEVAAAAQTESRDPNGIVEDFEDSITWARELVTKYVREAGYDGMILAKDMLPLDSIEGDHQLQKAFVVFSPEQIKSATGNSGSFDPANPDIRYSVAAADAPAGEDAQDDAGLTPPEQGLLRRVQAAIQDQMNRVKQVQERIEKMLGQPLPQNIDYYLAETNRPGRIAARLEDGENDLFTPLMERLAKAGHTPDQMEELLHAMHAQERNETVARINPDTAEGSGMSDDKAAAILKQYEGAEFTALHKLADDARAIARHTLDLKLAYGLLTPERHEQLTTHYEFYVPLKGDGEYGVKVKQAMGHDARDEYIVENLLRDFKQAVVAGEKNMARQVLLRMILKNPDDKLWSVGIPPKGRYIAGKVYEVFKGKVKVASFDSPSAVAAFMEGKRGEAVQYTVKDSAGMQVAEFTKQLQDNEVMVYLDGQAVRVQIYDEALAKQLRPLDRGQMNWFWQQSQALNRYYSKIYTGYNPAFILRNAARDAMTGTINMMGRYGSTTAAKAWGRYPQALGTLLYWAKTGKIPKTATGDMLRAYRDQGGKVGASHMGDLEAQGVALQRIYEDAKGAFSYAAEGKVGKASWIAARKAISQLARVVEIANQATENALRLALFMELRSQGETPAKSAQAAKTVTVDFDRKGASTSALSAAYLFFNPAIQGSANGIMTLAKGKHRKQAWAAMGGLAVLGYWLASKGMDEDKDRWLGEKWDIRTKNLIINGKEHQIRVPMSQEFAPFFAFGNAMAEVSRGEKKSTVSIRMVSAFLDAYVPLRGAYDPDSDNHGADLLLALVPSVGQMPAQLAMNRNSFGSQIVPESDFTSERPDNLKMNRATKNSTYDKVAQKIADAGVASGYAGRYENDITKVSPETLKLLWSNFTGGLGTFIADSVGVAAMGADPSIDVTRGEMPIVKDFVRTQTVKPLRSRYFELSREARTAIDEFKQAKKAGDGEAMDKVLADEGKAAALDIARVIKADSDAAKLLREEAVDVNANPDLTPGQKRARLKELEKEEEDLYREAIQAFKE